jgi:hypothetical protein
MVCGHRGTTIEMRRCMGKELDELSKALASGVSRRAAVRRFVVGSLGAVAASLLPGRTSFAQSRTGNLAAICAQACSGCRGSPQYGQCVQACEQQVIFNTVFNSTLFNACVGNIG